MNKNIETRETKDRRERRFNSVEPNTRALGHLSIRKLNYRRINQTQVYFYTSTFITTVRFFINAGTEEQNVNSKALTFYVLFFLCFLSFLYVF